MAKLYHRAVVTKITVAVITVAVITVAIGDILTRAVHFRVRDSLAFIVT